jgi:hypothetical protein
MGGPGPVCGHAQPQAAAAADQAPGDGEDPQPQPSRFPAAGRAVKGEHLHPGQQLAGQRDDLAPDLVLGEAVQGQVAKPGVLGAPDPVLAPGPALVPQFQVGQLPAAGVGGEADIRCICLSSCHVMGCWGGAGEGGVLVIVLAGGQAVVQAAEEPPEQVAPCGGVPLSAGLAPIVVGAGAG